MSVKLGVPLNDETLARMEEEERRFWLDFLDEARRAIEETEESGKSQPYEPSASLRNKYGRAIAEYNGSIYCQVNQLQGIFKF